MKSQKEMSKKCKNCHNIFKANLYEHNRGKANFCSRACRNSYYCTGKPTWNKGLTKKDNPDKITYGLYRDKNPTWRGGTSLVPRNYAAIKCPTKYQVMAINGLVLVHRLLMAMAIRKPSGQLSLI